MALGGLGQFGELLARALERGVEAGDFGVGILRQHLVARRFAELLVLEAHHRGKDQASRGR